MNAADFRAEHGDPMGDPSHLPWTPSDWDVWDHLHSADRDPQRDRADEDRYARIAAERGLKALDTPGSSL